jgi:hypothetical protein
LIDATCYHRPFHAPADDGRGFTAERIRTVSESDVDVGLIYMLKGHQFLLVAGGVGDPDEIAAIADDHAPEFRPYCEMDRHRLAELMNEAFLARDVRKWAMLREHLHDKLTERELDTIHLANEIFGAIIKATGRLPSPEATGGIIDRVVRLAAAVAEDPGAPPED